ncbi:hypothetical protein LguiB_004169 [Lonicera macranthoides]
MDTPVSVYVGLLIHFFLLKLVIVFIHFEEIINAMGGEINGSDNRENLTKGREKPLEKKDR